MKLWVPVLALGLCGLFSDGLPAQGPAKGKEVTLKGKICCAKCELEVSKKCASVIVVKENAKDVVYYFDAKSNEKYHGDTCSDAKPGEVTGVVSEMDGKKVITISKLMYAK